MSEHCMNGPAKAHTLHTWSGSSKALKTAAASGRLPADIDPVRYVRLARAIADHWPSDIDRPPAPSPDTAPEPAPKLGDSVEYAGEDETYTATVVRLGKPGHREALIQDDETGLTVWKCFEDINVVDSPATATAGEPLCACGHPQSIHVGEANQGGCAQCYGVSDQGKEPYCKRYTARPTDPGEA
jgi:hypothetical protein